MTAVTDAFIDDCGFRMFDLDEIARTMVMADHPRGGAYAIKGNKRERMAKYGNAVTPPASQLILSRVAESLGGGFTILDLFCGAGGSAIGAVAAGGELVLGVNHWRSAVEDHADNFPEAEHDCADVSALTTSQIRRYPDADVLWASPECTNHSLAKGARRRKPQAASLFDDGPAGDDEQDRSRATMWDVCRFAEQKLLRGRPFKAIVVENVVDAFKWGANDDGQIFAAWRMALEAMGYEAEIVWLNSMFAWPTPQSRDRMYVVYWLKGIRRPNLEIEPVAWCPTCELVVNGHRVWKKPDSPVHTRQGKPTGAKYGQQYLFACPDCRSIVLPAVFPAASAIDFSIDAPRIGDRSKPLAVNTFERIRRGLERLLGEPFAIRLTHGGNPKPLTLPIVTLTQRHDLAMVMPIAGNTFERTPGNRARDAQTTPGDTLHRTLDRALVLANRAHNVPRDAELSPTQTATTAEGGCGIGVVHLRNHQDMRRLEDPLGTVSAGGGHHGLILRNNGKPSKTGWQATPLSEPTRTLTDRCHQSLVVPYGRTTEPRSTGEPLPTQMTRDRFALLVPASSSGATRNPHTQPSFVQVTETRPSLLEIPEIV